MHATILVLILNTAREEKRKKIHAGWMYASSLGNELMNERVMRYQSVRLGGESDTMTGSRERA